LKIFAIAGDSLACESCPEPRPNSYKAFDYSTPTLLNMVVITIEGSRKLKRAPDLPYTISLPDPNVSTVEDVKKLLALKFPKVSLNILRVIECQC
jgi:hypothetical protein